MVHGGSDQLSCCFPVTLDFAWGARAQSAGRLVGIGGPGGAAGAPRGHAQRSRGVEGLKWLG